MLVFYKFTSYNSNKKTLNRKKGVLFMQRMMQAVALNMNDSQRKGLIVISPILIGSVAYGLSATFMIATNLLQIMF